MVRKILEGSRAVAEVVMSCKPDVIAAYPITPQTHIVEDLAKLVADGELDSKYIMVESEFSAQSACQGASAAGSRTYTATSSQGLALMYEALWASAGMRLPIVMTVANRALSAPINIWNDQQDTMAVRESGWIQLFAETNQEAVDNTIKAFKISEDHDVLIPSMVCMDGFVLTHTFEPVDIPTEDEVAKFLPEYKPKIKLDPKNPVTMGPVGFPDSYWKFRKQQNKAMSESVKVIKKVYSDFRKEFGRGEGNGLFKTYGDGDVAIVSLGSVCGTIKDVIDEVGGIRLIVVECFRPFPREELAKELDGMQAVGVLEKDISIGIGGGALWYELKAALQGKDIPTLSFVGGLGGRDITLDMVRSAIEKIKDAGNGKKVAETTWL